MKQFLTLILTLVSICSYASDVDGVVLLDNSSDHSGITIKFIPLTTSAVYTETTSDQNGVYSLIVENGVYNISFEKNGYQTYLIENKVISADITLQEITLDSTPIVYVSGTTSGTWIASNTYIFIGNATVPENETLTINPGVEVKFDGYFSLIVEGTLTAIGNESNRILFTSNKTDPANNDWRGILINNANTLSELVYCTIEYGNNGDDDMDGLVEIRGNTSINHTIIRNSKGNGIRGVYQFNGDITVKNSEIYNCDSGIKASGTGEVIIENNFIHDNVVHGIRLWMDTYEGSITGNRIGNSIIGIVSWQDALIERNIIYNNSSIGLAIPDNDPIVRNNTFYSNKDAINISNQSTIYSGQGQINSNIFYNNSGYAINTDNDGEPSSVNYNLFFNNTEGFGNNMPVGTGVVLTTNANGTDSDTYYNIFEDPYFLSLDPENLDFCRLAENSKAIDAGDPSIPNLFDSTIVNIGAIEGFGTLSIDDISENHFNVFPNPVTDYIKIQSNDNSRFKRIILYNLTGQIIKDYKLNLHQKEYTITKLDDLKSGLYFVKVFGDNNKVQNIKLLKK